MFYKLLATFLLSVISLYADYTITYEMGCERTTFYYKDAKHAKITTQPDEEGNINEIYLIDGVTYAIYYQDGQPQITNLSESFAMIQASGISLNQEAPEEKIKPSIKKTAKKEKVGGINGEVWILKDSQSKEEIRVVVTKDKGVVDATNKMFNIFSGITVLNLQNPYQIDKGYVIIKAEGMELKSFSKKKLPRTLFVLPKVDTNKRALKQQ